jgi:hypothetical protein
MPAPEPTPRTHRRFATAGGIYAAAPKAWPYASALVSLQCLLVTVFSVAWLIAARQTACATDSDTWRWVCMQSMWHLASAIAISLGCYCTAPGGSGCLF